MVREIDGLRALQVRVAGNDHVGIVFAEGDECALEADDLAEQRGDLIAQPESHVEGDLVIARPGSVKFRTGRNALGQRGLDVHVDVFEFGLPLERAVGDLFADLVQSLDDGLGFPCREHANLFEHRGVGHGAGDVVSPQPPVEGDGFGECGDVRARPGSEASAA